VVDLGRGTPLLMHDGWVASWGLWLPLIERLQHRFRCIAFDHRGSGASTFPPGAITADALVDDLFRVLDAAAVDRAILAGESLGAITCLRAVLRDPSRFLGLVLAGGFPRTAPAAPVGDPDADASRSAVRDDWPGYVAEFVTACLPEPGAEALRRFGQQTLLPAGPEAALRMTAELAGLAPPLEDVGVPTLVVHGALDAISPPTGADELAARIADADLVTLDDAGHVPILTRPDVVASAVQEWVTRRSLAI
jgi:pimeloyl-ACP methyl ester carboxylesterase